MLKFGACASLISRKATLDSSGVGLYTEMYVCLRVGSNSYIASNPGCPVGIEIYPALYIDRPRTAGGSDDDLLTLDDCPISRQVVPKKGKNKASH